MINEKFIIAGRACSGKTRLAECLAKALGVTLLKTCTTRPRRTPDEDTYHFYTKEEGKAIPKCEKLFWTTAVDGYERWTGKGDFLEAGVAVLDMEGIPKAVQMWQEYGYTVHIVYVEADTDIRRKAWIKRAMKDGKNRQKATQGFEFRENSESPMFDQIEMQLQYVYCHSMPGFASKDERSTYGEDKLDRWVNDFTPASMDALIHRLCDEVEKKNKKERS